MIYTKVQSISRIFKNGNSRVIGLPRKERSGYGVEGFFIKLKDGTGLKLFAEQDHAQRSHDRQKLANRHDIAPEVCTPVFEVEVMASRWKAPRHYYGYKTQIAKTNPCNHCEADDCETCKGGFATTFTPRHYKKLKNKLKSLGLGYEDLHEENVGLINNKWVCIDFGDVSTETESDCY